MLNGGCLDNNAVTEIDTAYSGFIDSLSKNNEQEFKKLYNDFSRKKPSNESLWINDNFLIFALVLGIVRYKIDRKWIYKESWGDPRVPETTSVQKATSSITEVVSNTIKKTASNIISPTISTAREVISVIGGFSDPSNSSGNSAKSNFQHQLKKDEVKQTKKRGRSR